MNKKAWHLGLIIYASVAVFLFVYIFPFIFTGYRGQMDDFESAKITVLDLQAGAEYPLLTDIAVWFAKHSIARFVLSILFILIMLCIEFILKDRSWKQDVYYAVMWTSLLVFMLCLLGLIALLV